MRILVTGGAGFIGSHVVDAYLEAGHEVVVLDDLSTGRRANLNAAAKFYQGDLTSPRLDALFRDGPFDIVNHHAAQVDVRRSVADPAADAGINITGTIRLLELCRQSAVPGVIFISTGGAMYGEHSLVPTPEDAPARPISPYGISKLSGERYVEFYHGVHGIPAVILRYAKTPAFSGSHDGTCHRVSRTQRRSGSSVTDRMAHSAVTNPMTLVTWPFCARSDS